MRTYSMVFASLLLFGASAAAQTGKDECYTCHASLGDDASTGYLDDIHRMKGLTCASCHGGDASTDDMERAMDPAGGFKGKPSGDDVTAMCASCHADQEKMVSLGSSLPTAQAGALEASIHGVPSVAGPGHAIQCTDCHGVHGIRERTNKKSPVHPLNVVRTCSTCHANTEYMRQYNPTIPTDQLSEFRTSVHGRQLSKGDAKVATCVSCHGSHEVRAAQDIKSMVFPSNLPGTCAACHANEALMKTYGLAADQYEEYAGSVHGIALLQKRDLSAPACNDCHGNHGAVPPGVGSIGNVCGSCHVLNAELFSQSPHRKAFADLGKPMCETCHGNHRIVAATNALIGNDGQAVCSQCHSATKHTKGFEVAGIMRSQIDSLEHLEEDARTLVEEAEQKGMEVSEAKFKLREIRQARLRSRTAIHAFELNAFSEILNSGMETGAVVKREANAALEEYDFRRGGFGVATLIITFLAVTLYLTIRRIERRQEAKKQAQ